jgi:hypothetical protein
MDFMIAGYPLQFDSNIDNNYFESKHLSNVLDIITFPSENNVENSDDSSSGINNSGISNNDNSNTLIDENNPINSTKEVFQTLWIGDKLSDMEIISLNSFVKHGLEIHLYCYQEIENVPKGVIVKDGRSILPESEIFTYKNGSYSAFSNLFRFTMLNKVGGYWVDTDFVCIKNFNFSHQDVVIVSEPSEDYQQQFVTSCMIKLPKASPETQFAIGLQREHKKLILNGTITWSSGPKTVELMVNKFGLQRFVVPWNTICSCFCHHARSIVDLEYKPHNSIISSLSKTPYNMIGLHLWNECWRRNGMDKNSSYPEGTIYQELRNRYLKIDDKEDSNSNNSGNNNLVSQKVIVYMVNHKTYLTKLARERFHGMDRLNNIEGLKVVFYGPGWLDYQEHETVSTNLQNLLKFGIERGFKMEIQAVIAYKPLELREYYKIPYLKVLRYNEMWDVNWTRKEILESGTQLVICHHMNDLREYQKMGLKSKDGNIVKYEYVAHCAENTVFKDYQLDKKYDIMLGGCLSPEYYPLRVRFANILKRMSGKYRTHIHQHPGYDLQDAHTNKYLIDFAKVINQSKIVLSCASKFNYRLGKYVEVPACASLLAADVPYDEHDTYEHMIQISKSMTDDEIIKTIEECLQNDEKYNNLVQKGIEFSSQYTQQHYAEKIYSFIQKHL